MSPGDRAVKPSEESSLSRSLLTAQKRTTTAKFGRDRLVILTFTNRAIPRLPVGASRVTAALLQSTTDDASTRTRGRVPCNSVSSPRPLVLGSTTKRFHASLGCSVKVKAVSLGICCCCRRQWTVRVAGLNSTRRGASKGRNECAVTLPVPH